MYFTCHAGKKLSYETSISLEFVLAVVYEGGFYLWNKGFEIGALSIC